MRVDSYDLSLYNIHMYNMRTCTCSEVDNNLCLRFEKKYVTYNL